MNCKNSLLFSLTYSNIRGTCEAPDGGIELISNDGDTLNIPYEVETKLGYINTEALYNRYFFDGDISLSAGLNAGINVLGNFKQSLSLPAGKEFDENMNPGIENVGKEIDIEGLNPFTAGLKIEFNYYMLFGRMYIITSLGYGINIIPINKGKDWTAHGVNIGISTIFSI